MMSLIHKEEDYFDLFSRMAGHGREAATRLRDLLRDFTDVPAKVQAIKDIEHEADRQVKKITQQLNASFITPIDRDDILQLTRRLDTICDTVNVAAQRLIMYNVRSITEDALRFAGLLDAASQRLVDLAAELRRAKKSKAIHEMIDDVNRIEHDGDELYHSSMRRLFSGSVDCLEVMKWNECYQSLEKVIDSCENVANTVLRIVVKYS
jgi:uncharacterized protein Yka (UPF0111/DUF47 family)